MTKIADLAFNSLWKSIAVCGFSAVKFCISVVCHGINAADSTLKIPPVVTSASITL